MLIYGSNSSHLKSEHLTEISCPHCGNKDTVAISVHGKYAHVFWIPTFPLGKQGVSYCQHCKQTLEEKEMPETFKAAFKGFKSNLKTPFWHFSGLLVIALIVGFVVFSSSQDSKNNQIYIDNPQVGDVYELREENGSYSLAKVTDVVNDSVYVVFNQYEIDRSSKLYTINKKENFQGDEYSVHHSYLQELFNEGDIMGVER